MFGHTAFPRAPTDIDGQPSRLRVGHIRVSKNTRYATANPISRYLTDKFVATLSQTLAGLRFDTLLDIGCGEGALLSHLHACLGGKTVLGVDLDMHELRMAKANVPFATVVRGTVYAIPFADRSADLVLCSEVLEHLAMPTVALSELCRVAKSYCVLTVPNEPWWRILNVMRGAYLLRLGNTPGHVNHWTLASFRRLLHPYFEISKVALPLPWIAVLCRPRDAR